MAEQNTWDFRGADFSGKDLRGCHFYAADLRKARLRGADVRGCDFRWALLDEVDMREVLYDDNTLFEDARLDGAQLDEDFKRLVDTKAKKTALGAA